MRIQSGLGSTVKAADGAQEWTRRRRRVSRELLARPRPTAEHTGVQSVHLGGVCRDEIVIEGGVVVLDDLNR